MLANQSTCWSKGNLKNVSFWIAGTLECIYWHESKQISVELFDEMLCAGHSDGHQDACLGKDLRVLPTHETYIFSS